MPTERQIEKAAKTAERMKPRRCKLPSCKKEFVPGRVQDWKSEFCCPGHQKQFWIQASKMAAAAIVNGLSAPGASRKAPDEILDPVYPSDASDALQALKPSTVYGVENGCGLPGCDKPRKSGNNNMGRFCCQACKDEYWHMAQQMGDQILRKIAAGSQSKRVYGLLLDRVNRWTARPKEPVFRDAVTKLRRRGHDIKCRRAFNGTLGRTEYEYMLVMPETKT